MDTITIRLSSGKETIIDACDAHLVAGYNWCASCNNAASTPRWYAVASKPGGGTVHMHRLIYGDDSAEMVDHIDNDSLNNRRSNLRAVSRAQNGWNRKLDIKNKSGYRHVYWSKQRSKWIVRMTSHGKYQYGGLFDDPKEAALAADRLLMETRGEFATLNFPEKKSPSG